MAEIAYLTARPMTSDWRFEWVTSWAEVWSEDFTRRWRGWMAESATSHVFFEPATVHAWVDTFRAFQDVQPRFLIARRGPDNLVFLPLVRLRSGWKDAWRRTIVPVGLPGFDYHDPILVGPADAGLWEGFWRGLDAELHGRWEGDFDLALINGLRSRCLPAEPERWLSGGLPNVARAGYQEPAPYIDLARFPTVGDYMASISYNLRHDLRGRLKFLRKMGQVSLRYYGPDEVQAALVSLETMLEHNQRRFPLTWRARDHYANLVRRCLPEGTVLLSEMRLGGQTLSWELDFVHHGRIYKYVSAFDPGFPSWSLGNLHTYLSLEHALANGIECYDFLRGAEAYKARWATVNEPLYEMEWIGSGRLASARVTWERQVKKPLAHLKRTARHRAARWLPTSRTR